MGRSRSSQRWLKEHFDDPYVKRAMELGYRSRAVFKLLEIQEKDRILSPGMCVVDLGAAPGGWSQVASKLVGLRGRVVALDILPMDSLAHVEFIQGDFTSDEVLAQLLETLGETPVDVVLSDMAPNASGIKTVDQPRGMYLAELALELAQKVLKPGGTLLIKVFHGAGFEELLTQLRQTFTKVIVRKPKASRARSQEAYLLARGFKS